MKSRGQALAAFLLLGDPPQSRHAASRAEALDVRIAISRKLLDGGVQRVHSPKNSRPRPSRHSRRYALDSPWWGNATRHGWRQFANR